MQLHQINLAFDAEQDRLLLRISTTDKVEYSVWLTRRLVKGFAPALLQLMQVSSLARQQAQEETRKAVVAFEHEKAVSESRFNEPYAGMQEVLQQALPAPLLAFSIRLRADPAGGHHIDFLPRRGPGFHLHLNDRLLHAFARLLQDTLKATDWNLEEVLPAAEPVIAGLRPN